MSKWTETKAARDAELEGIEAAYDNDEIDAETRAAAIADVKERWTAAKLVLIAEEEG